MTVFVVNLDKYDRSAALQYGDVENINMRFVYGDEIEDQQMPQEVMDELRGAAVRFDPVRDYLLIGGDHLQLVAFAALLGVWRGVERPFDPEAPYIRNFRVLRWDKKAEGYIVCWV